MLLLQDLNYLLSLQLVVQKSQHMLEILNLKQEIKRLIELPIQMKYLNNLKKFIIVLVILINQMVQVYPQVELPLIQIYIIQLQQQPQQQQRDELKKFPL